jgi:hypothetical protein
MITEQQVNELRQLLQAITGKECCCKDCAETFEENLEQDYSNDMGISSFEEMPKTMYEHIKALLVERSSYKVN